MQWHRFHYLIGSSSSSSHYCIITFIIGTLHLDRQFPFDSFGTFWSSLACFVRASILYGLRAGSFFIQLKSDELFSIQIYVVCFTTSFNIIKYLTLEESLYFIFACVAPHGCKPILTHHLVSFKCFNWTTCFINGSCSSFHKWWLDSRTRHSNVVIVWP